MVKCDKCPCWHINYGECMCGLSGGFISYDDEPKRMDEADCPLKRIELKDGTTYVPEIVGD